MERWSTRKRLGLFYILDKEITYLCTILTVTLHLQALTQIHQALVDLAGLSKRCPSRLSISRTLGACSYQVLKNKTE